MAPAKKGKVKDEEGAGDAAVPVLASNEGLHKRLADDLATIMGAKVFKQIDCQEPLDIGKGGFQKPYDAADFKTAMKAHGVYKCGFNVFMLNLSWSAMPGVPLVAARVDMKM